MSDLQQLIAINAIAKLKAQYCDACDDDHNGDNVATLFIEGGRWHRTDQAPFIGKQAIAEYMFSIREAGTIAKSSHQLSNPSISVNNDRAKANWRFTMTYTETNKDGATHSIIGRYEDDFICIDGQWYFESIRVEVEQRF